MVGPQNSLIRQNFEGEIPFNQGLSLQRDWFLYTLHLNYHTVLVLIKSYQDQYLHRRIALRGARGIQESEIIHRT